MHDRPGVLRRGRAEAIVLLGVRHALVGDVLVRGDVRVEEGRVAAVGVVPAGASGLAAPGFVDLQVNGSAASTSSPRAARLRAPPARRSRRPA